MEELNNKFNWRLETWFPDLSAETMGHLHHYHTELLKFNKRINLISSRSEVNADDIHFADSVLGSLMILSDTDANSIYDFGSGNGMPGLVMAILAPERRFYLIDADQRKVEFLKLVITRMGLENVSTKCMRIEDIDEASVNCAVSRGFANISKSLVSTRKILELGATYYHFKGDSWFMEVAEIPTQILANFNPSHLGEYILPDSKAKLSIVKAVKIKG